ncbi:hypothetical protein [Aneurinibacillus aneurinilyticus]|uniref:Uncharacterized protein n=1 Tax=Aneurinibacillus aneurinilyticus ATCC 12856 TaxID=649747 RepID=U1YHU4_ANEAE|nr:hypothetical protein [Aneurinibacillus aneurinilyticus]ERI11677.1 hypothetical protein HMPREF0083_00197 [Aneurinibacillus aneurinilyticus ATCC 12856]MED0708861.1 hypothetical protein [Aneurinibacillus aneurinilyticus]MED0725365.1 hypothetical protein [Aneurinibacillus aneurinilyticus]MED0731537.1 hypothetical protein [Aneurinibacillus aneurinilyticus]MED0741110.1 hypothetical protein [Aneurinibacillus aneurinilyticus]
MNEAAGKWSEEWRSYIERTKDKRVPQLSERGFDFLYTLEFKDASVHSSKKLAMEFLIEWRGTDYCFTYEDSVGSDSWKVYSQLGGRSYWQSITDFFGSYSEAIVIRRCLEQFGIEAMARDIQAYKDTAFERAFTERFSGMRIVGTKRSGEDMYFVLEDGEELLITSFYEVCRKEQDNSYRKG